MKKVLLPVLLLMALSPYSVMADTKNVYCDPYDTSGDLGYSVTEDGNGIYTCTYDPIPEKTVTGWSSGSIDLACLHYYDEAKTDWDLFPPYAIKIRCTSNQLGCTAPTDDDSTTVYNWYCKNNSGNHVTMKVESITCDTGSYGLYTAHATTKDMSGC